MAMIQLQPSSPPVVIYPDSDGQPMADNTKQFRWILVIQQNLDWLFADDPTVFVAGDLLWYPVEGDNSKNVAPDVMVAVGRPKGDRGSYQQWLEGNIAPQVAFEILSPSNTKKEMQKKFRFYQTYGVEEYYLYDPKTDCLSGWLRRNGILEKIDSMANWVSPQLNIRFDTSGDELEIYRPNGQRFLSYAEVSKRAEAADQRARAADQRADEERQRAKAADQRAETEARRAAAAAQRAETAEAKAQQLAERLRQLGLDPDQL